MAAAAHICPSVRAELFCHRQQADPQRLAQALDSGFRTSLLVRAAAVVKNLALCCDAGF
jgi:hypothetical protein